MRTMLVAFVAVGVIAVAADRALEGAGFSTQERTTGVDVRLGGGE